MKTLTIHSIVSLKVREYKSKKVMIDSFVIRNIAVIYLIIVIKSVKTV